MVAVMGVVIAVAALAFVSGLLLCSERTAVRRGLGGSLVALAFVAVTGLVYLVIEHDETAPNRQTLASQALQQVLDRQQLIRQDTGAYSSEVGDALSENTLKQLDRSGIQVAIHDGEGLFGEPERVIVSDINQRPLKVFYDQPLDPS